VTLTLTGTTPSGPPLRRTFTEQGGLIGRDARNALVLPHKNVSARHAEISFRDGVFYLTDTSLNGVAIGSPANRLARDQPCALESGDHLFIEPYELLVSIDGWAARPAPDSRVDPFAPDQPFAPDPRSPIIDSPSQVLDGGEVDPLKLLGGAPGPAAARTAIPVVPPVDDPLRAHYQPPQVEASPAPPASETSEIPPDYNPLIRDDSFAGPSPVISRPVPSPGLGGRTRDPVAPSLRTPAVPGEPPVRPPLPPDLPPHEANGAGDLADVLKGAGLEGVAVTPELARSFGQILRVVVSGLMDVLQARQRIKEEFQMRHTRLTPTDNNPLKFSANVEDALHNLLVKRNAAFLGPVDAFGDAFDDLRHHQLAMLAGMRVAFESMLAEFDPDRLQEQFDRQAGKGALPLLPARMRYWDLYRERRREMVQDPEAAFTRLFGREFACAYEEQFRRLKEERRR
jgi:type VI secretion system FHA domain protein